MVLLSAAKLPESLVMNFLFECSSQKMTQHNTSIILEPSRADVDVYDLEALGNFCSNIQLTLLQVVPIFDISR